MQCRQAICTGTVTGDPEHLLCSTPQRSNAAILDRWAGEHDDPQDLRSAHRWCPLQSADDRPRIDRKQPRSTAPCIAPLSSAFCLAGLATQIGGASEAQHHGDGHTIPAVWGTTRFSSRSESWQNPALPWWLGRTQVCTKLRGDYGGGVGRVTELQH